MIHRTLAIALPLTLSLVATSTSLHGQQQNGELIWSLASNPDPNNGNDSAAAVVVRDDAVYVAGTNGTGDLRIEKRAGPNGSLVWSVTEDFQERIVPHSLEVDDTGLYVIGWFGETQPGLGNSRWLMEKRSMNNGSLIWQQASDPTPTETFLGDQVSGSATDGTALYVLGRTANDFTGVYRIEKRQASDGALVWQRTYNVPVGGTTYLALPTDIALYGAAIYTLGWAGGFHDVWILEKRDTATGLLINSFGTDGQVEFGFHPYQEFADDRAMAIAVDSSGIYVVGDTNDGSGARWRTAKRTLADGSHVWGWTGPLGTAKAIAIDVQGVFVTGVDSTSGSGSRKLRIDMMAKVSGGVQSSVFSSEVPAEGNGIFLDGEALYVVGSDDTGVSAWEEWRIEKRWGFLNRGGLVVLSLENCSPPPVPGTRMQFVMSGFEGCRYFCTSTNYPFIPADESADQTLTRLMDMINSEDSGFEAFRNGSSKLAIVTPDKGYRIFLCSEGITEPGVCFAPLDTGEPACIYGKVWSVGFGIPTVSHMGLLVLGVVLLGTGGLLVLRRTRNQTDEVQ